MTRSDIFQLVDSEREYQERKWGAAFDKKNTPNDWIAYVTHYAGKGLTLPLNVDEFRNNMLKVAALAVAALEQETYAPRHYDNQT